MAEQESEFSDNGEMHDDLELPSGRLGAITRKQNAIVKYIEKGIYHKDGLLDMHQSLESKVGSFLEACEDQKRKSLNAENHEILGKYISKNVKKFEIFRTKLMKWIEECEDASDDEDDNVSEDDDDRSDPGSVRGDRRTYRSDHASKLLETLLKNQFMSKLPSNEPDVFSGENITEYNTFALSFERLIEENCSNEKDKFYYLLRYTSGDANQLVLSCQNPDAGIAFGDAKKLLADRYGNEYVIAQNYLDKLHNWNPIKSENPAELSKFASYLTTCANLMNNMAALNQLNSLRDIKEIMMKLPFELRRNFRSVVDKHVIENKEVNFKLLVDFVNKQSRMQNLPLIGQISDRKSRPETSVREKNKTFFVKRGENFSPCLCCRKTNHDLNRCIFFLKKSINDRQNFVKSRKLCFGCLKEGHLSKFCDDRIMCDKCGKNHPSSLHRDDSIAAGREKVMSEENLSAGEMNMKTKTKNKGKVICPTVPIIIKNKMNGRKVRTYAALDNYSTSSYMNNQIIKKLNLPCNNKSLTIKTIEGEMQSFNVNIVNNLEISSLDESVTTNVDYVYGKEIWPFDYSDSPRESDVVHLYLEKKVDFNFIPEKVGILIGMDNPEILQPREIVRGTKKGPYATRHTLGWALNGPVKGSEMSRCFRTHKVCEGEDLLAKFNDVFDRDFGTEGECTNKFSSDDNNWMKFVEDNTVIREDCFEIKLPFKSDKILGNNYFQVKSIFDTLTKKLKSDANMEKEYCLFMKMMYDNGFMEVVPVSRDQTAPQWYVAHHPVWHKRKKSLRVVFNCSLKYGGTSINDVLWKGPDLSNIITGVLMRFRSENVAVAADISKMFYRVKLPEGDRNYFKFFWFPNNDIYKEPIVYRMTAHIFGATSSPAVANFALKRSVKDENCKEVANIISKSFYVDDLMHSFVDENSAKYALPRVESILSKFGFQLTSYSSNSREILRDIDNDKLSSGVSDIDIDKESLPTERALGIKWETNTDTIGYNIELPEIAITKRGILSTIHSVYDPLFLASPAVIPAKKLFQNCCTLKLGWDEILPENYQSAWQRWKNNIQYLNEFQIPRCYKSTSLPIVRSQLHIFCDGSNVAYGAVAYLRQVDSENNVYSSVVMAKSRLTPVNKSSLKTTPRIELNAAKVGVLLHHQIIGELTNVKLTESSVYWSDSEIVLQYIKSETGRFHLFVANRVAYIRSLTATDQWRKIPGKVNPADMLSRGVANVKEFTESELWKSGPPFILQSEEHWPGELTNIMLPEDDPELKRSELCLSTKTERYDENLLNKLFNSCSDLHRLKCRIVAFLRLKCILRKREFIRGVVKPEELKLAEVEMWRFSQDSYFKDTYGDVKDNRMPRDAHLRKLNLFIDDEGLIRVGGRLVNSNLDFDSKFPLLLHADCCLVKLLVIKCHNNVGHLGRETVATELKRKFHIVSGNKLIRKMLRRCVICRKVQGTVSTQVMADLPADRVQGDCSPFTNVGTDLFGPFFVSKGRGKSQEKRYGIIFTCLTSRATHLEITGGLDVDSYINALRRFICRRGYPKIIRSDNGTNLVAADRELKGALKELNIGAIESYCSERNIDWKFQPPNASHFGGVFEREIRTVRKILSAMFIEFRNQIKMTDDILSTWFCEVENIMNCRPLTAVTVDNEDKIPLTANDLIRLNSSDLFPFGVFDSSDGYVRRRWRQAQYLSDIFWSRFKREYLPLLQARSKWLKKERSLEVGDVVIVVDKGLPRNNWIVGLIVNVKTSDDGAVRSCDVSVLKNKFKSGDWKKQLINRPIGKLILLHSKSD